MSSSSETSESVQSDDDASRPDPPSSWELHESYHDDDEPPFDIEHSLPTVEEIHASRALLWRRSLKSDGGEGRYSRRFYAIIAGCVLAVIGIIAFSAGIAHSKQSESSSHASKPEDPAQRDTDLLNLLFQTYKLHNLDTDVLTQKGSPQFQAIQWIADADDRRVPIDPAVIQRYVLAVMYFALGGSDWSFTETNWMGSGSECHWNFQVQADQVPASSKTDNWKVGVQCTDDKVSKIFLPNNNLVGQLPQEMGLLSSIAHFSVYKNKLTGELPQSLAMWTSLNYLNLQANQFSGQLGDWVRFVELEYLTLAENQFAGDLPSSFSDMTSLYEVALNNNMFTGGVDVLNKCTGLKILYLQNNQLDGRLEEDTFADFTRLKDLDLSNNQLKGSLPLSFYRAENVAVHTNDLYGTLPGVPYDDTHNLSYLSAYQNKLHSSIPASIGFLTSLTHLDLAQNQLTGDIPDEIQQLTNLQYLFLQKNPFTAGAFPSLYGLTKLKELSLQETNRNSALPGYIGEELQSLVLFDVHDNGLTGSIPTEFGLLTSMRFLFLNRNQLTGGLPWELMYLQKLAIFMIDQNELGGSDAAVCGENEAPTLTTFVADGNEVDCQCCTHFCTSDNPSCNTLELQVHDDNDFSRDHYVFGENLIFSRDD